MVEWVTIGRARLALGDCREILPTLGKVDAVVTDPPYGIGEAGGNAAKRQRKVGGSSKALADQREYADLDWDNEPIAAETMALVRGAGGWLVWDKCNGGNDFADCELAWTNLPKAVRRIQYMWNGMLREKGAQRGDHPTQKPLEVMKWAIGHLPAPNDTILDPFMGSGTTGVAALQMGKAFIGIEREPRYFEAACRRIREANGDDVGPLFGEAA